MLILIGDAVCITGQDDQVALGFTDEEGVLADGADGCRPDGLVVAADFSKLVLLAVLARNEFDDTDAFHEVCYDDYVVDYGDVGWGCGGSVAGELFQFQGPGVVVDHFVDDDLEVSVDDRLE